MARTTAPFRWLGFRKMAQRLESDRSSNRFLPSRKGHQFLSQSTRSECFFERCRVSRITEMSFYDRDSTVPFWRSNVDVDSLFTAHAHRPNRAQAWLAFRDATLEGAAMMRGTFELGILSNHTYNWTFTPTHKGELAVVIPVYENFRLVDALAISRHDHSVWGCVTGAGQYVGSTCVGRSENYSPLRVYKTPITWLLANCEGVLPLSKSFFPLLQYALRIIAENEEHAWELSELAFMSAAERLGLDCAGAERAALNQITFEVEA
jgi:hypothetical protein